MSSTEFSKNFAQNFIFPVNMQKLRKIPWVDELVVGDLPGVYFYFMPDNKNTKICQAYCRW